MRILSTIAFTQAIFPDVKIIRASTLWALIANAALANLLTQLGEALGFSTVTNVSLGILYLAIITLIFLWADVLSALLAGAITLLLSWVFPQNIAVNLTLVIVAYFLLAVVPYIWRDRTVTGLYENAQARLFRYALLILPVASWHFLLLAWQRPHLTQRLAELRRQLTFSIENGSWRNWSHTVAAHPDFVYQPESVADLQAIVRLANESKRKVRVGGRSYSWPNWVTTDEILVHCGRLDHVEIDLSDPDQPRIIAEAGATNRQINAVLEQHGLTLPSNVVLEVVRIGGTISTGSHGSGWHNPILSDYVHALDIVSADGEIRHFEAGRDSDEIMNAVRLSFGTFGIIWRVTLNVQPNWAVRMFDYRCSSDEMLAHIQQWVRTYDAVDIFYFPYCDQVWIKRQERLQTPPEKLPSLRHSVLDLVRASLQMEAWRPFHWLMHRWPRLTPAFSRLFFRLTPQHDIVVPVADWVHHRRSVDSIRLHNIEIAFKLDDNFESFKQAWQKFEEITATYANAGKYPFNIALNVRFIAKSNALLSPASGAGHTCYIEILSSTGTPDWYDYSGELGEAWLQLPHAAPHWPKQWEHIPNIDHYLHKRYAHRLRQFLDIRQELNVDPHNIFSNKLVERIMRLAAFEGEN